jgi:putative transposase
MVRAVREADKTSIADVAKKHAVSVQTLYAWKKQFGAMGVDDAKRLKSLEAENSKLKKLLAERMLDIEVLKDINSKKW